MYPIITDIINNEWKQIIPILFLSSNTALNDLMNLRIFYFIQSFRIHTLNKKKKKKDYKFNYLKSLPLLSYKKCKSLINTYGKSLSTMINNECHTYISYKKKQKTLVSELKF